jgi:hypothetical protein
MTYVRQALGISSSSTITSLEQLHSGVVSAASLPGNNVASTLSYRTKIYNYIKYTLGWNTTGGGSTPVSPLQPPSGGGGSPGGGVQIGAVGKDEACEAYRLADRYMTKYYPAWHERYPTALKKPELYFALKLPENGRFSWNPETLADPEGISGMTPAQALALLFGEAE